MHKKLLVSRESDVGESNDDCPIDGSKNQGKGSKKGLLKKGNKKTRKGKRKRETDDEGNASDGNYEVEKILKVKILKNGKKEFLIQWVGFSSEYNSWEPEANLDCEDLIQQYYDENEKVMCNSFEEETDESEGFKKKRSKILENRKKSTGRKRRLEKGNVKENKVQVRSNRSRMSRKGDPAAEQNESTNRVTRSSQVKFTTDRAPGHKRKREEKEPEGSPANSPPGKSVRGKSRQTEEDQNKENLKGGSEESIGESGWEESRDSGVDAAEYEVEKIVDVRLLENGSREFLIKWKGFSSKDNSWEPDKHLNCNAKVKEFLKGVEQNSTSRELRLERKATDRFTLHSQRRQRKLSSRLEKMPRKSYKEVD